MINWQAHHGEHFKDKKCLITGGAGFIGSHLIETLLTLGAEVVALDNLSNGSWDKLEGFDENVTKITGDILDPQVCEAACEGVDYIFHQAALGSVPRSVEEPHLYHEVCVMGTVNLLIAAANAGVTRVVYAGSSSAYGDIEEDTKVEHMSPRPKSPYAVGKLTAEYQMQVWASCYGLDTAITRYFNIFGPRQAADSAYAAVIAAFAKAMITGGQTKIFGDGLTSRDFTFVANAVHANLLAARYEGKLNGQVFNTACGGSVNLNELHAQMVELAGLENYEAEYYPERAGDVKHSLADISKAKEILGYEPLVDFNTGLKTTFEWYKTQF